MIQLKEALINTTNIKNAYIGEGCIVFYPVGSDYEYVVSHPHWTEYVIKSEGHNYIVIFIFNPKVFEKDLPAFKCRSIVIKTKMSKSDILEELDKLDSDTYYHDSIAAVSVVSKALKSPEMFVNDYKRKFMNK